VSEDLTALHSEKASAGNAALVDEMLAESAADAPDVASGKDLSDLVTGSQGNPGGGVVDNLFGLARSVPQAVSGAIDAVNEVPDLFADLSDLARRRLPGGGLGVQFVNDAGEFDLELVNDKSMESLFHSTPDLPTPKEGPTYAEQTVRGISKFAAGFIGAGKLKPLVALGKMGKAGQVAAVFAKGAVADATVIKPEQGHLSDLLVKYPALRNPVTEYLSSQPGDTGAEARFKNALEGMALGGAFEAVRISARLARTGYRSIVADAVEKRVTGDKSAVEAMIAESDAQLERIRQINGPVDAPLVEVKKGPVAGDRPPTDLAERLAIAAPEDKREVFINWSRIDSPDDVKAVVQKMADTFKPEVEAAQRGVRSWEATKLSAGQIDAFDTLMTRRSGEALNAEQLTASRELWVRSGTKLTSLARSAMGKDPAALMAFKKQVEVHRAIQREVIGARTEAARALNALKIPVTGGIDGAQQMQAIRNAIDGDSSLTKMVEKVAQAEQLFGERGVDDLVRASFSARTSDAVQQVWYAMMLSNPVTHGRVAVSNIATVAQVMTTRKGANLLGRFLEEPNVATGETAAGMFAAMQSLRDAFRISSEGRRTLGMAAEKIVQGDLQGARAVFGGTDEQWGRFYRALATGEQGLYTGTPDMPRAGAFDPALWGMDRKSRLGRVFDFIETTTSLPGRSLNSVDEVFGGAAFRFELNARAFRQATDEVAQGIIPESAFKDRLSQLVLDPEEVAQNAASVLAQQVAMRAHPPRTSQMHQLLLAVHNVPVLGKVAMPFPRTAWNVANFGMQYTPLAPMVREWRAEIAKGGANADIAYTKVVMGSALLSTFLDAALDGKIIGTGGGDEGLRASREAQGIQPNSIRILGKTFSIRSLGPFAELALMAANFADAIATADFEADDADFSDVFSTSALAVGQQTVNATYMRGAGDVASLLSSSSSTYEAEAFFRNLAGSAVPGAVGYLARATDPIQREAFNASEVFLRRLQANSLAPKRDRWGRTMTYSSGLGTMYDTLSPVYAKTVATEPVDAEIDRLGTSVTKPDRTAGFGKGAQIDLGKYPHIYSRYVEIAGQATLARLNDLITGKSPDSGLYDSLSDGPDGSKAMMIQNIVSDERLAARVQLLQEFPELQVLTEERQERRVKQLTEGPQPAGG
jgi:hypothetical protein